jgi:hypothetical protein
MYNHLLPVPHFISYEVALCLSSLHAGLIFSFSLWVLWHLAWCFIKHYSEGNNQERKEDRKQGREEENHVV